MEGPGPAIAFWTLAVVTLGAAGGVVASRNLMHAVLMLILSFLGVAGFFLLLSADFLAMAQVIIYVGAIAVLMLFAIILTPAIDRDNSETRMIAPALLLSVALATVFIFVALDTDWTVVATDPGLTVADLGNALLTTWVLPFEIASVLLTAAMVGSIMLARTAQEEAEDELS